MKAKKQRVRRGPVGDAPKDNLNESTPDDLTTAELLAVILSAGNTKPDTVQLASKVLTACENSLCNLIKFSISELMRIADIDRPRADVLAAFAELCRRSQAEEAPAKPRIANSRQAVNYVAPLLRGLRYVAYGILCLDRDGQVVQFEKVCEGGITDTTIDVRTVFAKALMYPTYSIVLCRNRVDGSIKPSTRDKTLAQQLSAGSKRVDVKFLDYLIIGEHGYYSFADEGKLY